jgi:hypothetical protein
VPEALRTLIDGAEDGAELRPFTRWSVPGLRLYCLSWAVPDLSSARVVGIDEETGAVVGGTDLLRRGGPLAPQEMARRVFGALLGQAFFEPLAPDEERSQFASEREWSLVRAPREEGGSLIFFSMQGDMAPHLVEHRVDLTTFASTTRTAEEVLLEMGEIVVLRSNPFCIPVASCGCWNGCARVEQVAVPGLEVAAARVIEGPGAGRILEQRRECLDGRCFSVCAADLPLANCQDAYRFVDEECGESCPPSEAPYRCETYADRCDRVDHPDRAAAAAAALRGP